MVCGRPVVTTSAGCAGLGLEDGHNALIHDQWSEFACAVSPLLNDEAQRHVLAANARRVAERSFSGAAIADRG